MYNTATGQGLRWRVPDAPFIMETFCMARPRDRVRLPEGRHRDDPPRGHLGSQRRRGTPGDFGCTGQCCTRSPRRWAPPGELPRGRPAPARAPGPGRLLVPPHRRLKLSLGAVTPTTATRREPPSAPLPGRSPPPTRRPRGPRVARGITGAEHPQCPTPIPEQRPGGRVGRRPRDRLMFPRLDQGPTAWACLHGTAAEPITRARSSETDAVVISRSHFLCLQSECGRFRQSRMP